MHNSDQTFDATLNLMFSFTGANFKNLNLLKNMRKRQLLKFER